MTFASNPLPTPRIDLQIDGLGLAIAPKSHITQVEILEDLEAPSMFAITLKAWDGETGELQWIDDSLFEPGNAVSIALGYDADLIPLIEGEITALEPEFASGSRPMLVVRGYDRRHRLMRGRKTRSFAEVTDSKIAGAIAQAAGLRFQGETEAKAKEQSRPYVLQHNQTDFEFLQGRAEQIGYEFFVEEGALVFRPMQPKGDSTPVSDPVTLDRELDEVAFSPRLSAADRVSQVEARGWDPAKKAAFLGKATVGQSGIDTGPKASKSAFGASTDAIADRPFLSQAEADLAAAARYKQRAVAYVTGDGSCRGNTGIRAGRTIALTGFGERFSGDYYVTSATHTYSPRGGYQTAFNVRRND